jgi:hypothetical protein
MKKGIWMSFDLGVRGDYEGLYTWLDSQEAIECGDNFAFIKCDISDDIVENIKKEIEDNIEINKKSRIYIIFRDPKTEKMKGKFIFGRRKSSPWTGYSVSQEQAEEEEA